MWNWRQKDPDGIERQLRSRRFEARDSFVESLSARVAARSTRRRHTRSRLAFAGAVSVFILGTFASFGGLSYAASGADGAYHAVKAVPTGHLHFTVRKSSATAQYAPTPKTHKKVTAAPKQTSGTAGVQASLGATKTSGTLPFTGLSLVATAILSLVLIGVGLLLRRREHQS
jgi:hypothetical protein